MLFTCSESGTMPMLGHGDGWTRSCHATSLSSNGASHSRKRRVVHVQSCSQSPSQGTPQRYKVRLVPVRTVSLGGRTSSTPPERRNSSPRVEVNSYVNDGACFVLNPAGSLSHRIASTFLVESHRSAAIRRAAGRAGGERVRIGRSRRDQETDWTRIGGVELPSRDESCSGAADPSKKVARARSAAGVPLGHLVVLSGREGGSS